MDQKLISVLDNSHNITQEFTYLSLSCHSRAGIEASRLSKKITSLLADNVGNNVLVYI
jgi:hypothetical protein